MKVIAIVAARVKSERFPAKVFELINGQPMLWHVYQRARQIKGIDEVVVATSFSDEDRSIVDWCQVRGIPLQRGGNSDENDVLSRYWDVATNLNADVIVRVTADCPCLDPNVSGEVLALWQETGAEFATNRGKQPYPDGYDTEVFSYGLLSAAYWTAKDASEREHVTPWMIRNASLAMELNYEGSYGNMKLSVDTADDLAEVRALYSGIGRDDFGLQDVIEHFEGMASIKPQKRGKKNA
ncbi:MAG: NTP transferase domain-containing protein [Chloroflexi bacterium]|nr:NTP transferase domain-containing protein [Chloroflexota bacterium]